MSNCLPILILLLLSSCSTNNEKGQPFITNDQKVLDEYAEKALEEAGVKLDSMYRTGALDTLSEYP
jgi:hypothetical protein